jgi:hypothetical protein
VWGRIPLLGAEVQAVLLLEVVLQLLQHVRLAQECRALDTVLGCRQIAQLTLKTRQQIYRKGKLVGQKFLKSGDRAFFW